MTLAALPLAALTLAALHLAALPQVGRFDRAPTARESTVHDTTTHPLTHPTGPDGPMPDGPMTAPGDAAAVPIPVRAAHRPTVGGVVVPFVTPRTLDGRYLLGTVDSRRQRHCLNSHLCGVCGRPLPAEPGDRLILLMRLSDLPQRRTCEPALDPVCAAYTQTACPMVAGRLSHHRSTPKRLGVGMAPAADTAARLGAAAEPWFAVWLPRYHTVVEPRNGQLAASYAGIRPLRIRPVTYRRHLPW